ncbi:hypothetical protein E2C01_081104 [Portunus trituberculatus]|uniref:Uncharacterized protein n=1 Tax=Portunus trituberculatus TaxID=210409 RepID=A0A5B7ILC3_PORTR|nr:hypothetical protein [Portunus trituberculatus]
MPGVLAGVWWHWGAGGGWWSRKDLMKMAVGTSLARPSVFPIGHRQWGAPRPHLTIVTRHSPLKHTQARHTQLTIAFITLT